MSKAPAEVVATEKAKLAEMEGQLRSILFNEIKAMVEKNKLIELLAKNRSILFVGSGFASDSINFNDDNLPRASELSKLLSQELKIEESSNLMFTSDFFLEKKGSDELLNFLKNLLSVKNVSSYQKNICNIPWMRVYTTNYDNSIELSYKANNLQIESIDTSYSDRDYLKRENICLHINGMLNQLDSTNLNGAFKLTDSSYLSPETFTQSNWYFLFKTDLERASIILFLGYSLYDLEVKKLLKNNKELQEKTFFIVHEQASEEERFLLSKYGNVLPIGLRGFSELISENQQLSSIKLEDNKALTYLSKFEPTMDVFQDDTTYDDDKIKEMLIYGKYDSKLLEAKILSNHRPYFIMRKDIEKIYQEVSNKKNVLITSKLGNGKTFLLNQIKNYLFIKGQFDIYQLEYPNIDYYSDIEKIHSSSSKSLILIDDFENYIDILKFIISLNSPFISVIVTTRSTNYLSDKNSFTKELFDKVFDIDHLEEAEINDAIEMINNLGQWGINAKLSDQKKIQIFQQDYNSEISSILVGIFKSEVIRRKIDELFQPIKLNQDYKKTIFVIMVCNMLGIIPDRALISDIADNDEIYKTDLERTQFFKNVYFIRSGFVYGSSSVFSNFIVNNFFEPHYITENFLKIAKKIDLYRNKKNSHQEKIFKAMLKFSFIESTLSNLKIPSLRSYYQELKKTIPWLKDDPHFWLQYCMCQIALYKYDLAKDYLETAYSLASRKINYDISNLDNQKARLLLLECKNISDGDIVYSKFAEANNLLTKADNDIYKFRRLEELKDFNASNFHKLSKVNKEKYLKAITKNADTVYKAITIGNHGVDLSYLNHIYQSLTDITTK